MGILLGNTIFADIILSIRLLRKCLKPGTLAMPSSSKSKSGLLRKNNCNPPTRGNLAMIGFITILNSAASCKYLPLTCLANLVQYIYLKAIHVPLGSIQREIYVAVTVITEIVGVNIWITELICIMSYTNNTSKSIMISFLAALLS